MWMIARDDSSYLEHHGIKGQKWGIRRFQNEDGTLTPEGEKRYGHMKDTNGKSAVTKRVMNDWWNLDDDSFKGKYHVGKEEYSKRVRKYGDPYKNSPMANWARKKNAKKAESLRKDLAKAKANGITDAVLRGESSNDIRRKHLDYDLKGTGTHLSSDGHIKKHEKKVKPQLMSKDDFNYMMEKAGDGIEKGSLLFYEGVKDTFEPKKKK